MKTKVVVQIVATVDMTSMLLTEMISLYNIDRFTIKHIHTSAYRMKYKKRFLSYSNEKYIKTQSKGKFL